MVTVPVAESFNTHVMAVKAHRPSQRPLLVICGYLPASDDELNQHIASTVLQGAGTTREDFVFMADWNRTPNQQPFCNLLAGGLVYAMDSDRDQGHPQARGRHLHGQAFGLWAVICGLGCGRPSSTPRPC